VFLRFSLYTQFLFRSPSPLLFWSLAASLLVAGRFSSGRSPWTYFFVAFFGAVGIFVLVAAGALFFFFRPVDSFFGHAILFCDGMNFAFLHM
jgi:hypothetical protein